MSAVAERFVTSADGTRIAVYEENGTAGQAAPTIVLVHGWPDSHVLWDGVAPLLTGRFRVVRYDNRGVGNSDVPSDTAAYTMARFADDFAAVAASVSPQHPVHVLAHDWGSVGVWEYLGRPDAPSVVASFTSVSGPSARHLNRYIKDGLRRPYLPRRFARGAAQLARLSYMGAFSVPVLAPAAVRWAFSRGAMDRRLRRDGVDPQNIHHSPALAADAARSMKVYRANYFRTLRQPRAEHGVTVPVQVIVNRRDPYVRPYAYDDIAKWVPRLWRRDLHAGHWAPMSHPAQLAAAVGELVDHLQGAPAARTLARARVGVSRPPFGDQLVSITGAGSGIGRATALAFAERGAEIVVSDIDEDAAAETAAQISAAGGTAHAYRLDVADADAVERFAEQVCDTHGVPDILVNNAGVGHAGFFLDTPAANFDRVMDINFGGVVNCCRAFAARMVDRGLGGHVVNVASMAAYAPTQSMNAYATSKAAVFMFSDCLRAELDSAGIGLTTVCPGVIDTNIVSTTQFDMPSAGDSAVEAMRAQIVKGFKLRRYGPEKVAKAIVAAVQNNTPVRPVTPEAYLVYGAAHALPQVMRSTARVKLG
ncbi:MULTISPECIES: SDR family oxidoreductase [Mycobacteriaceae]|uniref:Short-chain dehydrogenase n=1 Tax=Mycolicibacterium neoaurum VKM Ac-1815D TaxID=700508 RepID=V5XF73_MYCNE|nr:MULTISPECIES: SDR family oxidoreductase [Mycobacteriaceae]AHC26351.1 short-chain dehydrogenase [Mycolicibacterium neoaurum VKM Ac-1815D]AMO06706.1 short-chain dehydrogenase [Mycolicibacterium neoaurum]AXK74934.1 SDR family oxidoreductase [Mycolicibacterium neoaurum]KJQ48789.1 short-chain dehydrogenase [Mycolicibacterium neoaurum]KUM07337.1 short-chain dehydrogenase [Mycolicibacterium neoaurum]